MATWLREGGLVRQIEDAATRLAHSCRGLLEAQAAEGQADGPQAAECGTRVEDGVRELLALLQGVPELAATGTSAPLAGTAGAVGDHASTTRSASRLLQLPDDLLHRVGRLVGKESRLLCSRLHDAYGPPGHTVRQPLAGFEVEVCMDFGGGFDYDTSYDDLQSLVLQRVLKQHGSKLSLEAIASCSARWPGWAAQVTRLELADSYAPNVAALWLVRQALPGLQQLVFAATPEHRYYALQGPGSGEAYQGLPRFAHLTQLCVLFSSHSLLKRVGVPCQSAHFELLPIAPNLRSLHLDLRFLRITRDNLRPALQPLAQLTHLELVCSPEGSVVDDVLYWEGVNAALLSLASRLQSLAFLSPLAHPSLWRALQAMTCLTRLGWCIGYDLEQDDGDVGAMQEWQLPPSVRQLVVGTAHPLEAKASPYTLPALSHGLESSAAALPELRSLTLPVVHVDEYEWEEPTRLLRHAVGAVAARCPGLTALRCGCSVSACSPVDDPEMLVGAEQHWLRPMGRLQHLRQLVLTLPGYELDVLACLAGLPLLAELWLVIDGRYGVAERLECEPQHQPGSGLAQLASLEVFALFTSDTSSVLVHSVLAAAARLPRLRVLDLTAAAAFTAHSEAWRPLAASPPPALREVRLGAAHDSGPALVQEHRRTRALLSQLLPPDVVVRVSDTVATCWDLDGKLRGPLPEMLADVTVRWGGEPGQEQRRARVRGG